MSPAACECEGDMTNQRPPRPPTRNCRLCGGELEITIVDRPGAGPNSADTVCKKCGDRSGYSWARFGPGAPETHAKAQGPGRSAELRRQMANRPIFENSEGHLSLQLLLDATPFPVFAFKGRPHGLRLQGPGGSHMDGKMTKVFLGYRAGDPHSKGAGLSLHEHPDGPSFGTPRNTWSDEGRAEEALMIITGAVSLSDPQLHSRWFHEGNMYGDWNIGHILGAPWRRSEIQAAGFELHIDLKTFEEPQRACYFSFAIPTERPMHIVGCAVNLEQDETLQALTTLVDLKTDDVAASDNQAGIEESFRLLWPDR